MQVNIHEAKTNLSRLLTQVENGEEIILVITDFGEDYGTLPTMLKSRDCAANYHDIGIHSTTQQDSANHHVF